MEIYEYTNDIVCFTTEWIHKIFIRIKPNMIKSFKNNISYPYDIMKYDEGFFFCDSDKKLFNSSSVEISTIGYY